MASHSGGPNSVEPFVGDEGHRVIHNGKRGVGSLLVIDKVQPDAEQAGADLIARNRLIDLISHAFGRK